MSAPSGMELLICLIPAVIVIVIALIVIDAIRRKPAKIEKTNIESNRQTNYPPGDVGNVNVISETDADSQNGLAVTSLIISIMAILIYILFGPTWANCLGPLAMIVGAIALLQIRKQGGKGKGVAIVGIVMGTLPFIITLITTTIFLISPVIKE